MDFGWLDALTLLGSLGFFIYGMKVMSEGIQKAAGSRLRQILGAMTQNRFLGLGTGIIITALVQSSSATTVMTVSFVNAGLMTLAESAGVLMGANIGTTITGWLVTLFGFKVKIVSISLPIIAAGLPLLFVKRGNLRFWGEFLIGFALLFMGLDALKNSVPDLKGNPEVLAFLADYANMGILTSLLFILVGTVLTIVVQSSSAAMALTLTMCHQGWIPFEVAAPMILGENIGTTITAQLASTVGNVHAKRSASIHALFNIIGVLWMIPVLPFFLDGIDWLLVYRGFASPLNDPEGVTMGLATFHTLFNITNVLVLIGFTPFLTKIAIKTVKSKGEEDEKFTLEYLGTPLAQTTETSLLEARNQVAKFGKITERMLGFTRQMLNDKEGKDSQAIHKRIAKYEEITDKMEVEIADYLLKLSERELTETSSLRIRSMLSIVSELERIGDVFFQISKSFERKRKEKSWFTPEQRNSLNEMIDLLDKAFAVMVKNLGEDYEKIDITEASELEKEINQLRKSIRKSHMESIESGIYNIRSGMIYADIYNSSEKLGDHIINISEAVSGQI